MVLRGQKKLIQNGVAWTSKEKTVSIITKDAPLISLGGLEAKRINLCNGKDTKRNQSEVYSWPMNNFWETNFKVDLGGFYEFRYILDVEEGEEIVQHRHDAGQPVYQKTPLHVWLGLGSPASGCRHFP